FRPQFMTTYFYVPKNTKTFTLYAQEGSLTVKAPTGETAYTGRPNGDVIAVEVGEGQDGKVWSLTGKSRNLWFLDIPTVLASEPQKVFLPKEVADRDGLSPVSL